MLLYEKEHSNQNLYAYHQTDNNLTFPLHLHDSFEFIAILDGEIELSIADKNYAMKSGDCAIIFPNQPHSYHTENYSKSYLLILSKDYVPYFASQTKNCYAPNPVFKMDGVQNVIERLQNPVNQLFFKSDIYLVLANFYQSVTLEKSDYDENFSVLQEIIDFINENFTEDLTLSDLAEKLGYTYNYTSLIFNKLLKTSFSDMLNECRVHYASKLLAETGKSVTEIATLCGYESLRALNRNFIKFKKIQPSVYRKNLQSKNE